ncbi:transcriptional regulator [Gelidibacter algens]|jgi:DNA-binding XRE family transcriptional regulator|uniref:helix-turn-helix domain-containing protein n=1 Tax=Gelidibacter algens TaxID=49280 RepID=UPI00080570EA|nr:helix-turn-helix transcriptional regulator [Gelidibacter algens]OBX17520.1 transcriptional regulator [Gelidibacter algens]OBX21008.1 transcriptional regulator [Gelidibacter algens]OBX21076.1 transcriptional regulator [Gelidibacter algens]
MKTNENPKSWKEHINNKYGKEGTESREKFEEEFETFRIGALIQEARKKQHLTQQQLAEKVGTTKNYISRIENNASDIRLSTLMRIIREGLGGSLKLSLDL